MTTTVPRQHPADVASASDATIQRNYLRTTFTHLVDLHVESKNADALFVGAKSAALHLQFDGVVESALEAIEIVPDRLRALDPHNGLNRRTAVQGCGRSSRAAPTAAVAIDAAKPTADLVRRILTVRKIIGVVHNRTRDDDPSTAALLCRINAVLETQSMTLQNLLVATGRSST